MRIGKLIKRKDAYGLRVAMEGLLHGPRPVSRVANLARFVLGGRRELVTYRPLELQFDVTYRCNLHCSTCFLRHQGVAMNGEGDMTPREFERILDRSDRGAVAILLGGGEPLMYPHVGHAIRHIVGRGLYCTLSSNGVLLGDAAEELLDAGLHSINVSLDAHDAATYEEVRGAGARTWSKLMTSVQRFRTVLDSRRVSKRFQFRCNFTLSRETLAHSAEMIRVGEDLGFDLVTFNNMNSTGAEDHTLYTDDPEVAERMESLRRSIHPGIAVHLPVLVDRNRRGFCRDPFALTVVRSGGAQGRCCFDPPERVNGDFLEEENAFNSPAYRRFRKAFVDPDAPLPQLCRSCYRRFEQDAVWRFVPERDRWVFG